MKKKKESFREELGSFEKKIEKGLRHAEKKYGAPIERTRDKFYSYYNKLSPEQKFKVREYAEILGVPALAVAMMGASRSLALPVAVLSEVPVFLDIREEKRELEKGRAKEKLKRVI